jgi:hypothetical protein
MRALGVAVATPDLDDDLRLGETMEYLPVELPFAELGIKAFAGTVLSWWAVDRRLARFVVAPFVSSAGWLHDQRLRCPRDRPPGARYGIR